MHNQKTIAFVAATNFHVIVSYLLKSLFKDYKKILVINKSSIDALNLFNSIKNTNHWDEVVGIDHDLKKIGVSNFFLKAYKNFYIRNKIRKIIKHKNISEVIVFTMGDIISNFFSGSNLLKKIYLGEDGTYPYISGIEAFDSEKSIKNLFKKFFFKELFIDFKERIDEIILFKPSLFNKDFDSNKKNILGVNLDKEELRFAFAELNTVFKYTNDEIYKDADVIFFDSGMISKELDIQVEQFEYTFNLISKIFPNDKKILIKMSPYASQLRIEKYNQLQSKHPNIFIDYANLKTPWEIIYFNNLDNLKNVVLSSYRSSACISPYFFFDVENDIVILSKFILNHEGISNEYELMTRSFIEFAKKINDEFEGKSIYLPHEEKIIYI